MILFARIDSSRTVVCDGCHGKTAGICEKGGAHFSVIFPPDEHFTMGTVGDKDEMRFRIEVFNSVDGSCRLMAIAGWLRFVCLNGLIIGTALMQLQQQHRQQLEVEELGRRVGEAIDSTHLVQFQRHPPDFAGLADMDMHSAFKRDEVGSIPTSHTKSNKEAV